MPARKRAGKRLRAPKSASAKVVALALDMEVPLNEAIDAVHALRLIGHGMAQSADDAEGRAVAAVAWTARQRLDTLQQSWRRLFKCAARAEEVAERRAR